MKNAFFDYKVTVVPDWDKIASVIKGDNAKAVFVVVKTPENEGNLAYLSKILSAAALNLEKDCLLLIAAPDVPMPSLSQVAAHFTVEKVLLFGVSAQDVGLNATPPQYFPFSLNGVTVVCAEALPVIEKSPEHRKALWACLQQIFPKA